MTGRSIGIIDFAQFHTTILDAVAVLEAGMRQSLISFLPFFLMSYAGTASETGWTSSDRAAFREWNKRYVSSLPSCHTSQADSFLLRPLLSLLSYYSFLTTHKFGIEETGTTNNHGVWADMQRAGIAAFLGWGDSARAIINGAKVIVRKTRLDEGQRLTDEPCRANASTRLSAGMADNLRRSTVRGAGIIARSPSSRTRGLRRLAPRCVFGCQLRRVGKLLTLL